MPPRRGGTPTLPPDVLNEIGGKVGNVGRLRQTARAYTNVSGDAEFNLLDEQGSNESVCFSRLKPDLALVKVQVLRALRTKFLHLSLVSKKGNEDCSLTFGRMYGLLRHACDRILVLRLQVLGPSLMSSEQVGVLFREILSPSNTIRVLQIQVSDVAVLEDILRQYPTLEKVERLSVMLPDLFVNLRPGETVFSTAWYPNVVQRLIFDVMQSFEPERYVMLKDVEIVRMNGADVDLPTFKKFRFGFRRENGRIVDIE